MPAPPAVDLQDVFDFAEPEGLPEVPWLRPLRLASPRRDVRCLAEPTRRNKRILDLLMASSLLVLVAPLMLVTAILVWATSPGPIIFRQTRVGLNLRRPKGERRRSDGDLPVGESDRRTPGNDRRGEFTYGREFVLYKFRTMRNDAEKNGAQFAQKGDARVTSIGWFLRRTRIDELPQLWNVLRGDMSMVGPRPERPEFIRGLSEQIPAYLHRLGMRPGLTGVAQIVNGYDNDIESFRRKVAFDLKYLQSCCLSNDLRILFRTIWVVLSGKGAL